ncbi:TrgA family protein [Thalassococcus lentus]|uniref:TrgA family protein n=1 Tax=Thalassococcus lentus TaxID=1210524 RepID=A0ABT4XVL6_9RHOB|nr:TrgA family protein [Thalassococcus lentus]MDA7426015.1 TrgA family protein [Thalassococcus lentus]
MPTAAKMVAALCLAALGYAASEMIKTLLPASTDFGIFSLVNAVLGFLCGWIIVGTRAGRGFSAAISNGFTGMVALVFWGLFIQAANEMTRLAMRHRYDGPVEALAAVFEIMVDFGKDMLNPGLLLLLLVGSIIVGLISELAGKHWR